MSNPVPRNILDTIKYDIDGNPYEVRTDVGPKVPLVIGSGAIESHSDDNLIAIAREHWKMILFTNPGESISDQDFGCGLYRALFQNMGEDFVLPGDPTSMIGRIYEQAARYLPYLTVRNVEFQTNPDDNVLSLVISYVLDGMNLSDSMNIDINNIRTDVVGSDQFGSPVTVGDIFDQYNQ